jgi:hypothetical protein
MSAKIKKRFLRIRIHWYFGLLVILGTLGLPFMTGCGNSGISREEQKRMSDSIADAKKRDSLAKLKEDSVAKVLVEKAKQDSTARADSIARPRPIRPNQNNYKPPKPIMKYGCPVNNQ